MATRHFALLLAMIAAACGQAENPDSVILPPSMATELLTQCSREAPSASEGTWLPSRADIEALEAALSVTLTSIQYEDSSRFPTGWRRQYVGILEDGERVIYGNFFPISTSGLPHDPHKPVVVCDGGPKYFGVEYDVKARHIMHIAFNGSA